MEGYGLYWFCLEMIASEVSKEKFTFELEHDCEIIAHISGIHYERVNEMMTYMVNLGLFESDAGVITCLKMAKRLDQSMTSNPEMRKIINSVKNHDSAMTPSDKVMQDETRLDEIKETYGSPEGEPIEIESSKKGKYTPEFECLWKNKPERQGGNPKAKAFSAFKARLKSGSTPEEILSGLERYKLHLKEQQKENTPFVMQMSTFLGPDEHYKEAWTFNAPIESTGQQQRVINDL